MSVNSVTRNYRKRSYNPPMPTIDRARKAVMGMENADEAKLGEAEPARLSIDEEGRYVIRFAERW